MNNIILWACVPIDSPSDNYPQANWTKIEVDSWDEWRALLDFHGIIRWEVVSNNASFMPLDIAEHLEESNFQRNMNKADGAARAFNKRFKQGLSTPGDCIH